MKEHSANVSTLSRVVSYSIDACKATTEKVDKLIADKFSFMEDHKSTYNANTVLVNKSIKNVGTLFQMEKVNFVELLKALQFDHEAFQSSINVKITNFRRIWQRK
ncbi:unnamed protein product [Lactuca saligna]|uniref:Uncharacterized protein n=1 Tax=Lactuca saligna TaxID=75948 RepID=A0AA35ZKH5_LACSI|nr:unnamed protein product [Lactuca saligna]